MERRRTFRQYKVAPLVPDAPEKAVRVAHVLPDITRKFIRASSLAQSHIKGVFDLVFELSNVLPHTLRKVHAIHLAPLERCKGIQIAVLHLAQPGFAQFGRVHDGRNERIVLVAREQPLFLRPGFNHNRYPFRQLFRDALHFLLHTWVHIERKRRVRVNLTTGGGTRYRQCRLVVKGLHRLGIRFGFPVMAHVPSLNAESLYLLTLCHLLLGLIIATPPKTIIAGVAFGTHATIKAIECACPMFAVVAKVRFTHCSGV